MNPGHWKKPALSTHGSVVAGVAILAAPRFLSSRGSVDSVSRKGFAGEPAALEEASSVHLCDAARDATRDRGSERARIN